MHKHNYYEWWYLLINYECCFYFNQHDLLSELNWPFYHCMVYVFHNILKSVFSDTMMPFVISRHFQDTASFGLLFLAPVSLKIWRECWRQPMLGSRLFIHSFDLWLLVGDVEVIFNNKVTSAIADFRASWNSSPLPAAFFCCVGIFVGLCLDSLLLSFLEFHRYLIFALFHFEIGFQFVI